VKKKCLAYLIEWETRPTSSSAKAEDPGENSDKIELIEVPLRKNYLWVKLRV